MSLSISLAGAVFIASQFGQRVIAAGDSDLHVLHRVCSPPPRAMYRPVCGAPLPLGAGSLSLRS
jgi:hypothetical protein